MLVLTRISRCDEEATNISDPPATRYLCRITLQLHSDDTLPSNCSLARSTVTEPLQMLAMIAVPANDTVWLAIEVERCAMLYINLVGSHAFVFVFKGLAAPATRTSVAIYGLVS